MCHGKPFAFTLTSVTVQIATPSRTSKMLNLVSLEYRTLSSTISKKHDTGIMLSLQSDENQEAKSGVSLKVKTSRA